MVVLNVVFLGEGGDKAAIERGCSKLRELEPIIEDGLTGRAFLVGARPTIADLSLASSIFQLGFAGISFAGAHTRSWFERMRTIEGFRRSLPARLDDR